MNQTIDLSFKKLRLPLGNRGYPIHVGHGAVSFIGEWLPPSESKKAFIISDIKLVDARSKVIAALQSAGWETHEIAVHAGEGFKDFKNIYPIYGELLKANAARDSVLFALGGGSIGDAAGFIASTFLRGIPWVSLPTTLLAQVDSGIGGKTGVNHEAGKNLIGTFYQPCLTVCDTQFLQTLSQREVISGLGEIIKYAYVFDPEFLDVLRSQLDSILNLHFGILPEIIQRSLKWKVKIVKEDEFERLGKRALLNFGHTFGHALETITQYKTFEHGEAVILGMRFALAVSEVKGLLTRARRLELDQFLAQFKLPSIPQDISPQTFFNLMLKDKKVHQGKIYFVLLEELGRPLARCEVTLSDVEKALEVL